LLRSILLSLRSIVIQEQNSGGESLRCSTTQEHHSPEEHHQGTSLKTQLKSISTQHSSLRSSIITQEHYTQEDLNSQEYHHSALLVSLICIMHHSSGASHSSQEHPPQSQEHIIQEHSLSSFRSITPPGENSGAASLRSITSITMSINQHHHSLIQERSIIKECHSSSRASALRSISLRSILNRSIITQELTTGDDH